MSEQTWHENHACAEFKTSRNRRCFYAQNLKRLLDVVLAGAAVVILSPLFVILWLVTRLDGGPSLFCQQRVGQSGKIFRCLKFRTMVVDAEDRLATYLAKHPQIAEEWARHQKLKSDPRITVVGRFLRKSSLDELPQLFNVLRGDMSLVGPRPFMPEQAEIYLGQAYYKLRPGLTGYWQISDRHHSEFGERARFDDKYFNEIGFRTDFRVLVKTIRVVLQAGGC